jgi:hypothetical protein
MTTIQITLPDQLAKEAATAGLLASGRLEAWLRDQLKAKRVDDLFAAMTRMDMEDETEALTPEQVSAELTAMRVEARRTAR